jgi:hypothetical protein
MNRLTAFGLFAVTAMLVLYALEKKHQWCILGFAAALRARLRLWISSGRLALWIGRRHLGNCGRSQMVDDPETFTVARYPHFNTYRILEGRRQRAMILRFSISPAPETRNE